MLCALQSEHYLNALGDSSAKLQPKENEFFCHSKMDFLSFMPLALDRTSNQRLVITTRGKKKL